MDADPSRQDEAIARMRRIDAFIEREISDPMANVSVNETEPGIFVVRVGHSDVVDEAALNRILTEFRNRAAGVRSPRICVDLSRVQNMTSSGLASLLTLLKRVKDADGRLVLVGLNFKVRTLMDDARLYRVFDTEHTVEKAIARLRD